MNDGKCDPRGRFLAGTMGIDGLPGQGTLYSLSPNRKVSVLLSGVSISNGLDWDVDGSTMYYIDSSTQRIDAFDYDLDAGVLGNRRAVVEIPSRQGLPDGLAVDAEGRLWVALFRGSCVRCYEPGGRLIMEVPMPVSKVTSLAFGGDKYDLLFITTANEGLGTFQRRKQPLAGSVFVCRPGVVGRPPNRFGQTV